MGSKRHFPSVPAAPKPSQFESYAKLHERNKPPHASHAVWIKNDYRWDPAFKIKPSSYCTSYLATAGKGTVTLGLFRVQVCHASQLTSSSVCCEDGESKCDVIHLIIKGWSGVVDQLSWLDGSSFGLSWGRWAHWVNIAFGEMLKGRFLMELRLCSLLSDENRSSRWIGLFLRGRIQVGGF